MKLYKVTQFMNGKRSFSEVFLTRELAQNKIDNPPNSSHLTENGWVKDVYSFELEEFEQDNITFDIYTEKGGGHRISGLTLEKAEELYDMYSKNTYVHLQLPQKQFGSIGVTSIKDNRDEAYWKAKEEERERLEAEETWRPGDAPWDAPGMSVKDFI